MTATTLCAKCNYCYATTQIDGKPACVRCRGEYQVLHEKVIACPHDGTPMKKLHTPYAIVLDVCPQCDGVWVDGAEKALIKQAIREEGMRYGMITYGAIDAIFD